MYIFTQPLDRALFRQARRGRKFRYVFECIHTPRLRICTQHCNPWVFDEWIIKFVFKRKRHSSGETFVTVLSMYLYQNYSFDKVRRTAIVLIEKDMDEIPHSKHKSIRFYAIPIISDDYEKRNLTITVMGEESDIKKENLKLL